MARLPARLSSLLLLLLLALHPDLEACAASVLFITDKGASMHYNFLLEQQSHYPATLALKDFNRQGETLTGFLVWDQSNSSERTAQQMNALRGVLATDYTLADLCAQTDTVVAIGWKAASAATQACTVPVLIVLSNAQQVTQVLKDSKSTAVSAIYLEADPLLNLRLIPTLVPKAVKVGVLVSPQSQDGMSRLRAEAQRLGLQLDEIAATSDEEAVRKLRTRIAGLDALLLLPETTLVNEWSLKPILLMSARQYLPTVGGLTEAYVKAGVMAAVVADRARLHEQLAAFMRRLSQGTFPPPAYPEATRLIVNRTVARALSINTDPLPDPDAVH